MTLCIFILGAIFAGFIQGLTGFAFALIAMSFWVWILPPQITAPLVVCASLWCHIISMYKEPRTFIKPSIVWVYIIAGLIGVPLGTFLLHYINADTFKLLLGIFLLIWCPVMFFNPQLHFLKGTGLRIDGLIGFLGGILGGLGGFCGAIPSAWVMLKQLPKHEQRNILRHFNFAIQLFTLLIYLFNQTINVNHLSYLWILIFTVSLPTIIGAKIFYQISEQKFKSIVLTLLFFSGFILTLSAIFLY